MSERTIVEKIRVVLQFRREIWNFLAAVENSRANYDPIDASAALSSVRQLIEGLSVDDPVASELSYSGILRKWEHRLQMISWTRTLKGLWSFLRLLELVRLFSMSDPAPDVLVRSEFFVRFAP